MSLSIIKIKLNKSAIVRRDLIFAYNGGAVENDYRGILWQNFFMSQNYDLSVVTAEVRTSPYLLH